PVAEYVPMARGLGGRVRADITAALAYAGTLTARLRGDVGGDRLVLSDGGRTLLSLRRLAVTGLHVDWPTRVSVADVRLEEPFAQIERDRQGALPLVARFAPPSSPSPPPPAPATSKLPPVSIGQLTVANGRTTVVDETPRRLARIELPRLDLTARDATWPAAGAASSVLAAQLPDRGTVHAEGPISDPLNVDLAVPLKRAQLGTLEPYFGVPATVRARLDGNLRVTGPLTPEPKLAVRGDVEVRR